MLLSSFLTGVLAGLASGTHCAAMCGPLCAASCSGHVSGAWLRYQLGRGASYALAGAIAGGVGAVVTQLAPSPLASVAFGALVATVLGSLAVRLWRGASERSERSARSELVRLRTPVRPTFVSRVLALLPREPSVHGAMSALLPCGALLAALLLAASTHERLAGASMMLGFSLASAPFVLFGGALLRRLREVRGRALPRVLAVALCLLALFLGLRPVFVLARSPAETAPRAACH